MPSNSDRSSDDRSTDVRPPLLQPETMPTAKPVKVRPRVRRQAIPEKEDDRFFDRWMFDRARELGERAAKLKVVERLIAGGERFAEWRAEGKGITADKENARDLELIASTQSRIARGNEEAERFARRAAEEQEREKEIEGRLAAVVERRAQLSPALRGSRFDASLVGIAILAVFGVDLAVITPALKLTVASGPDHMKTAFVMGAGAAVAAAALGWLIAAGALDAEGRFKRFSTPFVFITAQLSILALWFFVELGIFRSNSLEKLGALRGIPIGDPRFFAAAQIFFFAAAVAICFSYFARRNGRALARRRDKLNKSLKECLGKVEDYRERVERGRKAAADAPIEREEALARIESRTKVAKAAEERDRSQGRYLAELIWVVYHKARADIEIGSRVWVWRRSGGIGLSVWGIDSKWLLAFVGTVGAGAGMYWITHSVYATILSSLIVMTVIAASAGGASSSADDDDAESPGVFKADLDPSPDGPPDGGSTDIVKLIPVPGWNGSSNGGGPPPSFLKAMDMDDGDDDE